MRNDIGKAFEKAEAITEDPAQMVARLALLPLLEYERVRKAEAKRLDMRVSVLDEEVGKCRVARSEIEHAPAQDAIYPDPVNGSALLDAIETILHRHVKITPEQGIAVALWSVFSYTFDFRDVCPLLVLTSPTKRCGKTSLLSILGHLVRHPLPASNCSPSAVFRVIEKERPTLLIDEADSFLKQNEELRGIVNSGHTRSTAFVLRSIPVGKNDWQTKSFSTWGPKVLAGIRRLPDTIRDRAVEIRMERKKRNEKVERLRGREYSEIRQKIVRWVRDNADAIGAHTPSLPEPLNDRQADNWDPLTTLADLAGGSWPDKARKAALSLAGTAEDIDDEEIRIVLLGDLKTLFERDSSLNIFTKEIIEGLSAIEEHPWPEMNHGKPITPAVLARLLRAFGIRPGTVRVGQSTGKGFRKSDFNDAFERYLSFTLPSPSENPSRRHTTEPETLYTPFSAVTTAPDMTGAEGQTGANSRPCDDVTDKKGGHGEGEQTPSVEKRHLRVWDI